MPKKKISFFNSLPKKERNALILAGRTTAGPLTVFMVKYPKYFKLGVAVFGLAVAFGFYQLTK